MTVESLRDMILSNDEDGIRKLLPSSSTEAAALINASVSLSNRSSFPTFEKQRTEEGAAAPVFFALHYAIINLFEVHGQGLASVQRAFRICKLLLRRGADATRGHKI
jgi:hypothetical protein